MIEKDNIKELFNQKLSGHEAPVKPELWNAISSQIGSAGAATSAVTIKSIILKSVIGISVASIAIASYIYITNPEESLESTKPTPSLIKKDNKQAQEEPLLSEDTKKLVKGDDDVVNKKTVTKPSQVLITPKDDILLNEDQSSTTPNVANEDSVKLNNPNEIIIIQDDLWSPIIDTVKSDVEEQVVTAGIPDDIIVEGSEETPLPFKTPAVVQAEDENITKTRIIIPNVFTPNGDGSNDLLFIESELLTGFSVVVLDLNNQVIFKSSDPNFKWDGRMLNGDMAPSGTYVYYVTAIDQQGNAVQKHSSLRINR